MGIIYGLICPISNEIRYIGQTIVPLNRRLTQHKCDKNKKYRGYFWKTIPLEIN